MSEKLDTLRSAKAVREATRKKEVEALESAALELEEKYEAAGKQLGIDFAVVTTLIGNFVVMNPEFIVAKQFADSKDKTITEVIKFVDPCVLYPDRTTARTAFEAHAGVAWKLATACMKLHEADASDHLGK